MVDTSFDFDITVRPQDDLFRHVNGKWLSSHEIPADKAQDGSFVELNDQSEENVKVILEEQKHSLYSSYMNEEKIERLKFQPIENILNDFINCSNLTELRKAFLKYYQYIHILPVGLAVYNDLDHPEIYGAHIYQSGLSLPDESYYRDEKYKTICDKFKDFVYQVFVSNDLTKNLADEAKEKLFDFEKQIASNHWDVVKCRDTKANHNPTKVSEINQMSGDLELGSFFDFANQDSIVDLHQPPFIKAISQLWIEENFLDWKIWSIFRVFRVFSSFLHQDFDQLFFNFYSKELTGITSQPDRWKKGVRLCNSLIGDEVGKIFVDRHFSPTAVLKMNHMVANLIEAYRLSISQSDWLSDQTKEKALLKLSKFKPMIGYPKSWHELTVEWTDDLVQNIINHSVASHRFEVSKIGQKIDKELWEMTPQTVNAYYNPPDNCIVFPAAILQFPFFSIDATDAQNYGGIGAVIGHEIGHGFDDQGSLYDGDGNLSNWWNDDDRTKFSELTNRLNLQFECFIPKQLQLLENADKFHVNGGLTTGENVGDVSGLKIALKALEISRGISSGQSLPDEEIKDFFYSFARIWKYKMHDEILKVRLATDPHSPAEFRANTVRNLDEFHRVFKTKSGDKLYLEKKDRIDIW